MITTAAAFLGMTLYLMGFAIFKVAAERMRPLRGMRPFHLYGQCFRSPIWLVGLAIFLLGLVPQVVALSTLPLSSAMPIFVASLIPLLIVAMVFFKERLKIREWLSLGLIALSVLLVSLSVRSEKLSTKMVSVSPAKLLLFVVPSLLFAMLLFYFGDDRRGGRHARPIAGIAYGISGGIAFGTAEIGVKGIAAMSDFGKAFTTPNPYIILVSALIGFAMVQVQLQRCRIAVSVSAGMITSKAHLLLTGGTLYREPWPHDRLHLLLRAAAFLIAVTAIALFPRHVDPETPPAESIPARPGERTGETAERPAGAAVEHGDPVAAGPTTVPDLPRIAVPPARTPEPAAAPVPEQPAPDPDPVPAPAPAARAKPSGTPAINLGRTVAGRWVAGDQRRRPGAAEEGPAGER